MQKVFGFVLLGITALAGMWVFNHWIAPNVIWFLRNLWAIILMGTPLTLLALYVISNPIAVWGFFKTLSVKLTKFLVKMDPLSVMDRYIEWLDMKRQSLNGIITILRGKKIELERKVDKHNGIVKDAGSKGAAAIKEKDQNAASIQGTRLSSSRNSLAIYTPLLARLNKQLDFLCSLEENWKFSGQKLQIEVDNKREEYDTIKLVAKGMKTAEEFIGSDNEAVRLYGMGVKALEESVTQKMGYIEDFERRSKDIMSSISIEKRALQDDGLRELENYMNQGTLLLPTDFSAAAVAQPVAAGKFVFNK